MAPVQPGFDWDVVRTLPEVEALTTFPAFTVLTIDEAPGHGRAVTSLVPADAESMRAIERPAVLDGRLADPGRADEAVVTAKFVESYGRSVGAPSRSGCSCRRRSMLA